MKTFFKKFATAFVLIGLVAAHESLAMGKKRTWDHGRVQVFSAGSESSEGGVTFKIAVVNKETYPVACRFSIRYTAWANLVQEFHSSPALVINRNHDKHDSCGDRLEKTQMANEAYIAPTTTAWVGVKAPEFTSGGWNEDDYYHYPAPIRCHYQAFSAEPDFVDDLECWPVQPHITEVDQDPRVVDGTAKNASGGKAPEANHVDAAATTSRPAE